MIKSLYPHFKELTEGGSIFIYSDPHFGDIDSYRFRHLVKIPDKKDYYAKQKGDACEAYESFVKRKIKEADDKQIKNINRVCSKNDTLIILGDVGDIECVKKLKAGYKILVLGNHDRGVSYYQRIDRIVEAKLDSADPEVIKMLEDNGFTKFKFEEGVYFKEEDNHLFDEVYNGAVTISSKIILSHEPIVPCPTYLVNLHGHTHDRPFIYTFDGRSYYNFCAEAINYTPVCLGNIIKSGVLKNIPDIHRETIDSAIERKKAKNVH